MAGNGRREAEIRVASIQMEPIVGDKDRNIRHSLDLIRQAADNGATLIVLPELANSGFVFESREEAFTLAEAVPGSATCDIWAGITDELGIWIAAGISERAGEKLYNSAVLIGPEGYAGTFRKVHLWNVSCLRFGHVAGDPAT